MLNKIDKEIYEKYYDISIFKEANEVFEKYIESCDIKKQETTFEDFNISTITCIIKLSKSLNIKVLFEQFKINDNILYLEYQNKIKGKREKKVLKQNKTNDKRMKKKGKTFANQLSIGFNCNKHCHKKPICLKVFSKGSLTLTGVKDSDEIDYVINNFYNMLKNIKKDYYYEDKKIYLEPYKKLLDINKISKSIETVNGSFKCNFNINLEKLTNVLLKKYENNQIYIKRNRSALIEIDIILLSIYDERKKKSKIPKVSVYGTGSIVLNSVDEETIIKSYNFIKKVLEDNYKDIVDQDFNFNFNL